MTKQGLKAIEEIQKGDLVLSYNDNLGIYDYKDVVDVYVNETTKLCHIKTSNDEIICTPNHSILTDKGWLKASEIRPQDTIQTTERFVEVLSVEKEELKDKIKVYNFNVLGYHTYIIGSDLLVVHNSCTIEGNTHGAPDHRLKMQNKANEMAQSGKYSKVYMNKSLGKTGVMKGSNLRPDIIGKRVDGGFDIIEIASASQKAGIGLNNLYQKVNFMSGIKDVVVRLIPYC